MYITETPKGESSTLWRVGSNMLYFMYVAWLFGKKSDLLWEAYLNFFLTESRQQKAALIRMDGVDGKLLLEEDL